MNIFDGPCPEKWALLGLLPVPVRSPLGAVGYQVWKHAFSLQRPRGALLAVEKTHWAACA